ncbi:MAG: acyl-CoA dehydrogenase family protein, partial [Acidimicrobiia bacterium]
PVSPGYQQGDDVSFTITAEQEELRTSVRRFLDDKSAEPDVRRLMDTREGYDEAVWAQMAAQLGLQGIAVPEQYGGAGYGHAELAVVFEEMGRALLPSPYFATVGLAANVLLSCGDEAAVAELIPGIAAGETIATVALLEAGGRWDGSDVGLRAEHRGGAWTLHGSKLFVLDGTVASLVLVVARTDAGLSIFAVDGDDGLTRAPLPTMDQTRKQARLDFDGAPARLLGEEGTAWPRLERALDRAAIALSAEAVCGAQRCLDMIVEYAKARMQFARPIGSFQAIKHKCAAMLVDIESARSAMAYAAWAADASPDEVPTAAPMAKAYCTEAFSNAAAENIQIHGGIGFTWEHPAHLYFKRARSSELLLGDPYFHRELLARRLGL